MQRTRGARPEPHCLDCLGGVEHDGCDAQGVASDTDWDSAWQTSEILTELRGLDRLDQAIREL